MHSFDDLAVRSARFSLANIDDYEKQIQNELQTSAATFLVKNLQMITMQRVILAVGLLSIFEANLQDQFNCTDGFGEARKHLRSTGASELEARFNQFIAAINVLKHGRGRSYEALLSQAARLPFRIKKPDENSFFEGDVSEISILIDVDNGFVEDCAQLISDVSKVVKPFRE